MKARVQLVEGMTFVAESGTGHAVVVDGAPDIGGRDLGPRPMELVLMGTGACSAIDVVHILRKARQGVTGCTVELEADRAETDPKVFTDIHMHVIVTGQALKEAQVKRAVELSAEKYCSASIMLRAAVNITHSYELRQIAA